MRTKSIVKAMERIVKRDVSMYQSDFYNEDYGDREAVDGAEKPFDFIWCVRNTGTWLIIPSPFSVNWYQAVKDSEPHDFYHVHVNEDGSGTITKSVEECDEIIAEQRRFRDSHKWVLVDSVGGRTVIVPGFHGERVEGPLDYVAHYKWQMRGTLSRTASIITTEQFDRERGAA